MEVENTLKNCRVGAGLVSEKIDHTQTHKLVLLELLSELKIRQVRMGLCKTLIIRNFKIN